MWLLRGIGTGLPHIFSMTLRRPLVLVHGLWNTPKLFNPLIKMLDISDEMIFAPYLRHGFGRISLENLANSLDHYIYERFGSDTYIDILGFSMGGIISRVWLQSLGGALRTQRFICVGSPQQGTLTAQLIPPFLFRGIADMKIGSPLINDLNHDCSLLGEVECSSYFCKWDLMAFPGWMARLPIGNFEPLPVMTHRGLITSSKALDLLVPKLLGF